MNAANAYCPRSPPRCLVEVIKLNLGQYSEARFGQDFKVAVQTRF